ncbi:hypothetical protein SAMN02927900_03091 [Rhizobium mongolense subsp. loessense]|uniref:PIN domain-containing protein n=1 Tax=Rhizobium mongolense subsp. loessense TaxID=158890 RepID=A0A1G4RVN5_9HYPH|nr:PIN domain-containing protein [Rhizobium mongolense]SCW61112.1 hypothetical protein SAMN02927900_03091 [Rhizobium mongolense subsp. loessense]
MRLLLDTNVFSEVTKPRPDTRVLEWLDGLDEDRAFISLVSIAEIRRGVALMDSGRKRDALAEWLATDLPQRFEQRVIPVEEPVALAWRPDGTCEAQRSWARLDGRFDRCYGNGTQSYPRYAQYQGF